MAPRNTKQGASASGRRTSGNRGSRTAATSSTRSTSTRSSRTPSSSVRGTGSGRTAAPAKKRNSTPAKKKATRLAVPRQWWTLPLAICAIVAIFAWTYYPVAAVQYRETRERARLAAQLESLQARNERLRKEVDRLKTPAGVEDYARSQLGLVKKGENVVVVLDGDEDQQNTAVSARPVIDSEEGTATPVGPWTAFLDLVFGLR